MPKKKRGMVLCFNFLKGSGQGRVGLKFFQDLELPNISNESINKFAKYGSLRPINGLASNFCYTLVI